MKKLRLIIPVAFMLFMISTVPVVTSCGNGKPSLTQEQRDSIDKVRMDSIHVADSINQHKKDSVKHVQDSIKHIEDSIKKANESFWQYDNSADELTGKETHHASITSENYVNFDFPYEGGSYLKLTVRKHPQYGKDVYIRISKGQFNSSYNGTTIKARFDDGNIMSFGCSESSSYDSDLLFIDNYSRFVSLLKKSKKCIIQAPFYQEGNQSFTFITKNLKWDY